MGSGIVWRHCLLRCTGRALHNGSHPLMIFNADISACGQGGRWQWAIVVATHDVSWLALTSWDMRSYAPPK
eukprot:6534990-Karenia_brevis.AAC.1